MKRELPYMNAFGTADISGAATIEEALARADMNWEVESQPIFDQNGNELPKYRANMRSSDGKLLGIVTNKYQIVQNIDALNFVDSLVSEGFKFDRAGSFRDGKSIWVMGNLPDRSILGDDFSSNIVFTNSHDGTSGVKVMMTPVRLVCSNMMNLALRQATRMWASKHTGGIYGKLEEAKYTLGLAENYLDALDMEATRLSAKTLSDSEIEVILDNMFPITPKDSERKIRNTNEIKSAFWNCYEADDIKHFRGTSYGAINAMSDLVSHKEPARVTNNYYENSWHGLINGNVMFDTFYKKVAV